MNIFLISLVSSAITLIGLFTAVEIFERIQYFKKDKNRIDFDKFLKAYDVNSNSWELYTNFVVYAYSYYPRTYSSRKNYEFYFTYSDLRKYKKWKKQLDKKESQRFFTDTMADIDEVLSIKEKTKKEHATRGPQMPKLNADTQQQFICEIIEHFENFLGVKGIELDNPEKQEAVDAGEDEDTISNIYGTDYGWLQSDIEGSLKSWGFIE